MREQRQGRLPAVELFASMPELPEVETIVRSLRNPLDLPWPEAASTVLCPGIVGRRVSSVELLWKRTLAEPGEDDFLQAMMGQAVHSVSRRGKFILMVLDNRTLLVHLRMSGDLRVEAEASPRQPHDRLLLHFEDGSRLAFNDTRKFGRVWLVDDPAAVTRDLGPEPFDEALTPEGLYQRLHASSRGLKSLLLDQTVIAGIGNIYSDEALHRAKLHPACPGNQITPAQAEALLAAIRETLQEGIQRNGASIDWVYRGGDFQNHFRVYQRTGEPCLVCGTPIERMVINQRSSHFCPSCQPFVKKA